MKLLPRKLRRWLLCRRIGISTKDFEAWRDALYRESMEMQHVPAHIFQPLMLMKAWGLDRGGVRAWLKATQNHPASTGVNLIHAIRAIKATDDVVAQFQGKLVAKHELAEKLIEHHLREEVEELIMEGSP